MPPSSFAPRKTEMPPVAFQYGEISLNAWLSGWNVDSGFAQHACHQMSKNMNSLYQATAFHDVTRSFQSSIRQIDFPSVVVGHHPVRFTLSANCIWRALSLPSWLLARWCWVRSP